MRYEEPIRLDASRCAKRSNRTYATACRDRAASSMSPTPLHGTTIARFLDCEGAEVSVGKLS